MKVENYLCPQYQSAGVSVETSVHRERQTGEEADRQVDGGGGVSHPVCGLDTRKTKMVVLL